MTKIIKLLPIILLSFLISSCIRTSFGDYDYDRLPELQFDDQLADRYLLNVDDSLQLAVDVMPFGFSEDDFTYRWYYYTFTPPSGTVAEIKEVGLTAHLNLVGEMETGTYSLVFEAKNKQTNVTYYKRMTLNVQRFTSEGWLVLTHSAAGLPNLSIVTSQGDIYRDFLPLSERFPIVGNPQEIIVVNSPNPGIQPIVLRTDDPQLYFLDYNTYSIQATANSLFSGGNTQKFDFFASDYYAMSYYLRDTNGNLYVNSSSAVPNLPRFSDAMLGGYHVSPLLLSTIWSYPIQVLAYDYENQQFVYQFTGANRLTPFQFATADIPSNAPFSISNFKDRIIYAGMGSSYNHYIVGLDEQNRYSLYGIIIDGQMDIGYPSQSVVPLVSPNGQNPRLFSLSGVRSLLYYIAGNDLYMYRIGERTHTFMYRFPEEEAVVSCEVFRNLPLAEGNAYFPAMENRICVATNNGTEGIFYTFDLSPTGGIATGTYTNRFDGFDRIIDITYKMLK